MGFTGKDGIIIWTAILVRVVLLAFGTYQDAHFELKYTDIDYEVYTDAAYFMWRGESPYKRSTYRYTPLLAALLTPNVYLHPLFGKVAFCCADIVAALLMKRLLGRRGYLGEGNRRWVSDIGVAIWLFSPFTAPISTRGNGESLVTLMLIGMLDLMETQNLMIAGLLYGLAVHWRLYPVIYSIPLCLHLLLRASLQKIPRQHSHGSVAQNDRVDGLKYSKLRFTYFDYRSTLWFFLPAGLVFVVLGGFFYLMYGDQFLQETYLYHATRTDPRHNFSPYFYPAYLTSQLCRLEYVQDGSSIFSTVGIVLQIILGWKFKSDIPVAMFLQTISFVAFNKVATAQYFVWYIQWLPFVFPKIALARRSKATLIMLSIAWLASLGNWLTWAYQLEFKGAGVHFFVWLAGLLWVIANAVLIREVVITFLDSDGRPKGKGIIKEA